jgi:ribonuclease BN (tRNA processing enzyme)
MSRLSYQYSIHCLSNGSEYTDTTLLLTVERGTTFVQRYALTGLTSLSARLAADQKVPLHTIKACFGGTKGLASLLLSLSQAGKAEVTVCGSVDNAETIASLILGKRSYPLVRTCEVPSDGNWYQVYQDDYLRAHGKRVGEEFIWIYSLLKHSSETVSFAVFPPNMQTSVLQPLPEDIAPELECIVFQQKMYDTQLAKRFFYTEATDSDDLLLKRARRYAQLLASTISFAFFLRPSPMDIIRRDHELATCSRLCLHEWSVTETHLKPRLENGDSNEDKAASAPDEKLPEDKAAAPDEKILEDKVSAPDEKILEELKAIWSRSSTKDDNEIDIDEEEDGYSFAPVPHLLILGTGCASPSALRGSSGCALFTPQDDDKNSLALTAIIDCGEGTLTNLHRHLPSGLAPLEKQLTQISFIWISHSHLDHYGGLADLILAIHDARCAQQKDTKRLKTMDDGSPIVIAPVRVLNFLDASLRDKRQLYRGVTHRDFEASPFAQDLRDHVNATTGILRSIPVEHCAHAHALILDIQSSGFRLCYSGDTRPSNNLIRCAGDAGISLLLHEATFDDDDRGKKEALQKRHSTVLEALDVAKRIKAKACLLTHFSQRYPKSPPGCENDKAAFAMDGMWMPLTDAAVEKLPVLSRLVQQTLK